MNSIEVSKIVEESFLRQRLQNYRHDKKFTDIIIKVGDKNFPAHRIVLEEACPRLNTLLTGECSFKPNVYELDEKLVSLNILEDLLTFFYTGKLKLTVNKAKEIYSASQHLNIPILIDECQAILLESVSSENLLELFVLSVKLQIAPLWDSCLECFKKEWNLVSASEQLVNLEASDLQIIIRVLSKLKYVWGVNEIMFEWIIEWVKHNYHQRLPFLNELLLSVQFHKLSQEFARKNVNLENLMFDQDSCSEFFLRVLTDRIILPIRKSIRPNANFTVYCFGGFVSNIYGKYPSSSVSRFDFQTNKWNSCSPMLKASKSFSGAVISNKIYICGKLDINRKTLININMENYDCKSDTWNKLPLMPRALKGCAAAALSNFVYVTGGSNKDNDDQSSVYRYEISTMKWQAERPMHKARSNHQLVTLNGRLYAIGGYSTKTVEEYSPETDQWRYIANTHYEHRRFGAASHDGRIYVFSNNGFEVYSPESNTWHILQRTKLNDWVGQTLVSVGDRLWVIGGSLYTTPTKTVSSYDPSNEQWTLLPDMDVARVDHRSFVVRH